jgi:hypothetical protein
MMKTQAQINRFTDSGFSSVDLLICALFFPKE